MRSRALTASPSSAPERPRHSSAGPTAMKARPMAPEMPTAPNRDARPDTGSQAVALPPLDRLIACPQCDALHHDRDLEDGQRARCHRCGVLLVAARHRAFTQVIMLSMTIAILMIGAVFFPFLSIKAAGVSHASSVLDAALAFSGELLAPLSVAVLAMIVLIPIIRVVAILYTLLPLTRGRAPLRHAEAAFRLAEYLRPWSMAEIFIIGTAVALVKVAGLASIGFGPAFWAFAAIVIVVVLEDTFMCKWTIWKTIGRTQQRS